MTNAHNQPGSPEITYQLARQHIQHGQWQQALNLLSQVLAANANYKNAHTYLKYASGRLAFEQEDWNSAVANFEAIAGFEDAHTFLYQARSKQQAQNLYRAALAASEAFQWQQAQNLLRQAVNLDPNHAEAAAALAEVNAHYNSKQLFDYGLERLNKQDWQKAIDVFEQIIKSNPQYPQIAEVEQALEAAQKGQRLSRLKDKGNAWFNQGNWVKAIGVYKQYLKESPYDAEINMRLAEAKKNYQLRQESLSLNTSYRFGRRFITRGIIGLLALAILLLFCVGGYFATGGKPFAAFQTTAGNIFAFLSATDTPISTTPGSNLADMATPASSAVFVAVTVGAATDTPFPTKTAAPTPIDVFVVVTVSAATDTPFPTETAAPGAIPTQTPTGAATTAPTLSATATSVATPSPTPSAAPPATPTSSPSATATPRATPRQTPSPTSTSRAAPTATATATPSPTPSAAPTATPTSSPSATATPRATPRQTPSPTSTSRAAPTATATATPSPTPSATQTATPTSLPSPSPLPSPSATPTQSAQSRQHTVQLGDTLSELALKYGVTVADIQAANNLADPNFIRIGQVLTIPGESSGIAGAVPPPTPTPRPTKSATPARFPLPTLLKPLVDGSISGITKFSWQWDGPALGRNHSFELRIWPQGKSHDGAADARLTTPDQVCPAPPACSLILPVDRVPNFTGNGEYFWTVAVVQLQPYRRVGQEAPPRRVFFNR